MAVPKVRISKQCQRMRRSHLALSAPGASKCKNCGEIRHPHRVCEACGHYRGKQVLAPKKANKLMETSFDTEA